MQVVIIVSKAGDAPTTFGDPLWASFSVSKLFGCALVLTPEFCLWILIDSNYFVNNNFVKYQADDCGLKYQIFIFLWKGFRGLTERWYLLQLFFLASVTLMRFDLNARKMAPRCGINPGWRSCGWILCDFWFSTHTCPVADRADAPFITLFRRLIHLASSDLGDVPKFLSFN